MMNIKFKMNVKETAKFYAKAVKDFVCKDPVDDTFIDKIFKKEKDGASIQGIDRTRNSDNK